MTRVEYPIYGIAREGVHVPRTFTMAATTNDTIATRRLNEKSYEITDHLGNVRVVTSDIKLSTILPSPPNPPGKPGEFRWDIRSYSNIYPYGMEQPKRNIAGDYRYGYNGMEHDSSVTGGSYMTYFREYDARLGRFWGIDPVTHAWESPYAAMGGNPIRLADPSGADVDTVQGKGRPSGPNSDGTVYVDTETGHQWIRWGSNWLAYQRATVTDTREAPQYNRDDFILNDSHMQQDALASLPKWGGHSIDGDGVIDGAKDIPANILYGIIQTNPIYLSYRTVETVIQLAIGEEPTYVRETVDGFDRAFNIALGNCSDYEYSRFWTGQIGTAVVTWGVGKGVGLAVRGVTEASGIVEASAVDIPTHPLGRLRYNHTTESWTSTGGLLYEQGSVHGNRVLHVLDHLTLNEAKPAHTLFNVERTQLLSLLDEAWMSRESYTIHQSGNWNYKIEMGRIIGLSGEKVVNISVLPGTNSIITAFPIWW